MSFSTVYRWVAEFKSGLQQLKHAASPGHATTTTKRSIRTSAIFLNKIQDLPVHKHVVITSSWHLKLNKIMHSGYLIC